MHEITRMKTYSQQDLAALLKLCADYLGLAYQSLLDSDLSQLSHEAYCAAEFLKYLVRREQANFIVH